MLGAKKMGINNVLEKTVSSLEAQLVEIKYQLEENSNDALWNLGNANTPYEIMFRQLQLLMIGHGLNIEQLQEVVNGFDIEKLQKKYGPKYRGSAKVTDAEMFGDCTYTFRIPFNVFIEDYKENKLALYAHCKDCGKIHCVENPKWFLDKDMKIPKRCKSCIKVNKAAISAKGNELGSFIIVDGNYFIYNGKELKRFDCDNIDKMTNAERWAAYSTV
jgi:hypothetical protein